MFEAIIGVIFALLSMFAVKQALSARSAKVEPPKESARNNTPLPPRKEIIDSRTINGEIGWFQGPDGKPGAEEQYRQHGLKDPGILSKIIQIETEFDKLDAYGKLNSQQQSVISQMDISKTAIDDRLTAAARQRQENAGKFEELTEYLKRLAAKPEAVIWRLLSGNLNWADDDVGNQRVFGGESLLREKYNYTFPILQAAERMLSELSGIGNKRGFLSTAQQKLEAALKNDMPFLRNEANRELGGEG